MQRTRWATPVTAALLLALVAPSAGAEHDDDPPVRRETDGVILVGTLGLAVGGATHQIVGFNGVFLGLQQRLYMDAAAQRVPVVGDEPCPGGGPAECATLTAWFDVERAAAGVPPSASLHVWSLDGVEVWSGEPARSDAATLALEPGTYDVLVVGNTGVAIEFQLVTQVEP